MIFLALAVLYGLTGAAIYWAIFRSPARGRIHTFTGVVAPYFGAVGILFSLLTGFLGAEVADRNRQAARGVLSESSALRTLVSLSHTLGAEGAGLRMAARGYLQAVLSGEWQAMSAGGHSPAAGIALGAMIEAAAKPGPVSAPVQTSLLNAAVGVANARAERLSFAADRTYELKWICVLLLGVFTQIALAFVHLEKPRAMLAAVTLFSIAAIVALGLIAEQENPFEPPLEISNAPLARTLAALPAEP